MAINLWARSNSQIIVNQIKVEYQIKELTKSESSIFNNITLSIYDIEMTSP